MNRDYSRRYRDASRFNEQDRYAGGRSSRYNDPSRYEDNASHWNDEQTARWLSHYGGASHRGERDYDTGNYPGYDRSEYAQGYGDRRSDENPRYGQRFQESWEGYAPDEAWRQRGAERISPGMHGRYGWRNEDDDQGSLNFQPGEYGYGSVYGPTLAPRIVIAGPATKTNRAVAAHAAGARKAAAERITAAGPAATHARTNASAKTSATASPTIRTWMPAPSAYRWRPAWSACRVKCPRGT